MAAKGYETDCERIVAEWLDARGVAYQRQVPAGRHFIDFLVPDEGTAYEADGAFWHKDQGKDIARDREILKSLSGLRIVHLHFFDPRHSPDLDPNPLPDIHYVACNPGPGSYVDPDRFERVPVLSLRQWDYAKSRPSVRVPGLYDLQVEGVHSFVANGMLVSNSFVEYGTGMFGERAAPHRIYPKSAKALSWFGKGASTLSGRQRSSFARKGGNAGRVTVRSIAGMHPEHYMRPAAEAARQAVPEIFKLAARALVARLAGK
jgi:hypothetical protein